MNTVPSKFLHGRAWLNGCVATQLEDVILNSFSSPEPLGLICRLWTQRKIRSFSLAESNWMRTPNWKYNVLRTTLYFLPSRTVNVKFVSDLLWSARSICKSSEGKSLRSSHKDTDPWQRKFAFVAHKLCLHIDLNKINKKIWVSL